MDSNKTNKLLIRTPEGILFSLTLAGPIIRALAWTVDIGCILTLTMVIRSLLKFFQIVSVDLSSALYIIAYFIISIGYAIVLEWYWRGQTLGKKLLRLRVMDVQGLRLQASQIVIRNIMRLIDNLPALYAVGGLACLVSGRAQRLGDFAANTIVVRNPELAEPDVSKLVAGKFNSLRSYPHLCARLRQLVTPQEAAVAVQAMLRRDELNPDARVKLFNDIAGHFRSVTPFPEEVTYGITDEQYVRNVVDILFSPKL
ncbi:MAG TPA: RDD family protein [Smithella sp.]|nr:RDD family protein [Smithella sp.]